MALANISDAYKNLDKDSDIDSDSDSEQEANHSDGEREPNHISPGSPVGSPSLPEGTSELSETDWDGVRLPPEPAGSCSVDLLEKIKDLVALTENGFDMNREILKQKNFKNPSIYEKLIEFCDITELGTNYPPEMYNPFMWGEESFYENLDKVQKAEMLRREKHRREKTKVEVVSGTVKRPGSGSIGNSVDDAKKMKSKWDQVAGGFSGNFIAQSIQQPALTSSSTCTRRIVLSALASLPKKQRN